jgi:hypothetical protein
LESSSPNTPVEKKPKLSEEVSSDTNILLKQTAHNAQQKSVNKTQTNAPASNATKPPKATKNTTFTSNSVQTASISKATKPSKSIQSSKSMLYVLKYKGLLEYFSIF